MDDKIYSISALNYTARTTLENHFSTVLVEGEISNFVRPSSGHWYLTLKDDGAQVRCAMFKSLNRHIDFLPENGMHVLVKARVSLYEGRGDFQLILEKLEDIGDGKLQKQFEQLKKKLDQQGLFDPAHKKPLPDFIQTIGVITSSTGAAIRDILSVLERRFPAMNVVIYPTLVQGQTAAAHITGAIETANARGECDALIVTRGGGSMEDLWPFNEECVARAIFKSQLPIISAVGHEIDFTIADFVADVRAPTPSSAAELVAPDQVELSDNLKQFYQRLNQALRTAFTQQTHAVGALKKRLEQQHPTEKIAQQSQAIDYLEQRLHHCMTHNMTQKHRALENLTVNLHALSPLHHITQAKLQLHYTQKTLRHSLQIQTESAKQRLAALAQTLQTLSPLGTLARGFAIVSHNNHVITKANDVKPGEKIETRLHKGLLHCTVNSVQQTNTSIASE